MTRIFSKHRWVRIHLLAGLLLVADLHAAGRPGVNYAIRANPRFVSPETAGAGFETLRGFMLQKGSPAIGAGIAISPNVDRDLFGNQLPKGLPPSIGIHEFKSGTAEVQQD